MAEAPLLKWITHKEGTLFFVASGQRLTLCEQTNGNWSSNRSCEAPSWIRCFSVAPSASSLVIATQCKRVQIYDISNDQISLGASIEASKRVTCIAYADDGSILLGDKSGRAYQWTVQQQSRARELAGVDPIPEESKPGSEPTLMLGHCSLLTDMVFDQAHQRLFTSDQDAKIRVNSYPKFYNIEQFLLGHTEYVSSMLLCGERVASASGDGTARLWNPATGEEIYCAALNTEEESKPASLALYYYAAGKQIFVSRGKVLFVLDVEQWNVAHQLSLDSHILGVTMVQDQLLVSTLEAPFVSSFSISAPFAPHPNENLVSLLRQSLFTLEEKTLKEIHDELFNLQQRRTEDIRLFKQGSNKRQRIKLDDGSEVNNDGTSEPTESGKQE